MTKSLSRRLASFAVAPGSGMKSHAFFSSASASASASEVLIPFSNMRSTNAANLSRLTVPSLQDTATRYLQSVQPFVGGADSQEYKRQVDLVNDFIAKSGNNLHSKLLEGEKGHQGYPFSYIEKGWDDMYLGGRW